MVIIIADQARLDQVTEEVVTIVSDTLGLEEYEQEDLAEQLGNPNFYEFWTMGSNYGSYKVYTNLGVPFISDQRNRVDMIKPIAEANEKIKALFA
jgi:hypothetical protein